MSVLRTVIGVTSIIFGVFVGCIALAIYLLDRFGILDDDADNDNDKEKINI